MQPRVTVPVLDVVDADSARREPDAAPAGTAKPLLLDVRERHELASVRVPGAILRPTATRPTERGARGAATRERESGQAVRRRRLRRPWRNARVRSLWLNT